MASCLTVAAEKRNVGYNNLLPTKCRKLRVIREAQTLFLKTGKQHKLEIQFYNTILLHFVFYFSIC